MQRNLALRFSRKAAKSLNILPPKHCAQISRKTIALQRDPHPSDYKHLSGFPDTYEVSSGEYRIIYQVGKEVIEIMIIGKRNDGRVFQELANCL